MAFVFAPIDKITTTVIVEKPVDGTKTERQEFKATFKKLNSEEKKQLSRSLAYTSLSKEDQEKAIEETPDIDTDINDFDLLSDNVLDLSGIKDPDDNELEFSSQLLTAMLNETYILSALMKAFLAITYDQSVKEAYRRKN